MLAYGRGAELGGRDHDFLGCSLTALAVAKACLEAWATWARNSRQTGLAERLSEQVASLRSELAEAQRLQADSHAKVKQLESWLTSEQELSFDAFLRGLRQNDGSQNRREDKDSLFDEERENWLRDKEQQQEVLDKVVLERDRARLEREELRLELAAARMVSQAREEFQASNSAQGSFCGSPRHGSRKPSPEPQRLLSGRAQMAAATRQLEDCLSGFGSFSLPVPERPASPRERLHLQSAPNLPACLALRGRPSNSRERSRCCIVEPVAVAASQSCPVTPKEEPKLLSLSPARGAGTMESRQLVQKDYEDSSASRGLSPFRSEAERLGAFGQLRIRSPSPRAREAHQQFGEGGQANKRSRGFLLLRRPAARS
eukprot:TRINITY_DN19689_c0_g1_i1.p1 TRINITY_DN19689_c0_g1~~TRINITY_DN19689_c0_g1_i1.p1  ORF type:complete len:372 (-),score=77.82 TRINITY_DN19689_c0_g1_i1:51-1166(-)